MTIMRNIRGDTIVEVLISIAVLGLVLGAAFTTSRRSLNGTIIARERDNALRIAQSQIEIAKSRLGSVADGTYNCFFINNSGEVVSTLVVAPDTCSLDTALHQYDVASSSSIPFDIETTYNSTTNVLRAEVTWERAGGGELEQLIMPIKVYQ